MVAPERSSSNSGAASAARSIATSVTTVSPFDTDSRPKGPSWRLRDDATPQHHSPGDGGSRLARGDREHRREGTLAEVFTPQRRCPESGDLPVQEERIGARKVGAEQVGKDLERHRFSRDGEEHKGPVAHADAAP